MNTYTFTLNNSTKNPSNSFANASKALDALLYANIDAAIPYLGGKANDAIIIKPKKEKTIDIDITISKKNKKKDITFADFIKAFAAMNKAKDTYDFKLDDGTPIKFFNDEIQIGYELFDIDEGYREIYNRMSNAKKRTIIDIYITK